MKKTTFVFVLLFSVFVLGTPSFAATVWLDEVISFDQPTGSYTSHNDPTTALGPDDDNFVSIDIPETLVLAFTDNSALDDTGYDLRIREYGNDSSHAFVYGSKNGIDWTFLIDAIGAGNRTDVFIDLQDSGLGYVNYLKFEGRDNKGGSPGFDLDAVEALNSGPPVPVPSAIWLLGYILASILGWHACCA